ncbi:Hypothetical protein HEAR2255 [Herminiimonas arsenicoxydans]|uniref:Uncharacterized protein n=1 Tax=Herminiimonas arsenicoxydans TaxID=204773 RepID=A4G7A1_HERAR|nr:Hypothetical protein HEAR2255 [Herminiimonas arsenicoxydans]
MVFTVGINHNSEKTTSASFRTSDPMLCVCDYRKDFYSRHIVGLKGVTKPDKFNNGKSLIIKKSAV